MRISDWSSDVCSSDLPLGLKGEGTVDGAERIADKAARFRSAAPGRIDHDARRNVILQRHRGIEIALADRAFGARDGADREGAIDKLRREIAVLFGVGIAQADRKSTRLNSSH